MNKQNPEQSNSKPSTENPSNPQTDLEATYPTKTGVRIGELKINTNPPKITVYSPDKQGQVFISSEPTDNTAGSHSGIRINDSGSVVIGPGYTRSISFNSEVEEIRKELTAAKKQLSDSQKQISHLKTQIDRNSTEEQLQELKKQIDSLLQSNKEAEEKLSLAQVRTNSLTAPVEMPTPEDMRIQLIPTHWFDRLEEYRSDEALVFMFIGLFAGTIMGTLTNWFTSENFVITRFAGLFLFLILLLLVGSIFWQTRISQRTKEARNKIMSFTNAQKKDDTSPKQP
ncbi:MAG: hypothetical protein OHK0022_58980 [Roseiflexaceae bacterium]